MRLWSTVAIVVLAGALPEAVPAQVVLAPCESSVAAEYQGFDQAVADARNGWRTAVADHIATAGLSDGKRQQFESAYAKEVSNVFMVFLKELETLAKNRTPLLLPAYDSSLCDKLPKLHDESSRLVTAYKQILTGLLEVLDKELVEAKKK